MISSKIKDKQLYQKAVLEVILQRKEDEAARVKMERAASIQKVSTAIAFSSGGYNFTESGHVTIKRLGESLLLGNVAYMAPTSQPVLRWKEWLRR